METICLEYNDTEDNNLNKSLVFSKSLLQSDYKEASLFVSKVSGQSMQPHIMDKALVVADLSQKEVKDGQIYLLHYDNNMWIKKASYNTKKQAMQFVSINPKYAHLVYEEKEVYVIARVLLTFTAL